MITSPNHVRASTHLALAIALSSAVFAADSAPTADQILRQMSDKLSAAQRFSFQAHREVDAALTEGTPVARVARATVSVSRPSKMAVLAKTNLGARRFYADGKTLTVIDEKANTYATVPMRTSIDGLLDRLDETYGFTPPVAEFAASNLYQDIRQKVSNMSYLGRGRVATGPLGLGGVECHRIALKGKAADSEVWIGVGDSLPRKLVATFHRDGHPQVEVTFTDWNLNAPLSAADFVSTPPKGSEKIEMWTSDRMKSVIAK